MRWNMEYIHVLYQRVSQYLVLAAIKDEVWK